MLLLRRLFLLTVIGLFASAALTSCGSEAPPMGKAVENRDSVPVMTTYGVSKLISDSGVVKYKIVSEEWRVFDKTNPPRQEFLKGIFLEQYNETFQPVLHITADTAYCYDQNLWELRGRVFVKNKENGTVFRTEELFWDMGKHSIYSNKYMRITTPDRDVEGNRFVSNEQMTKYHIWQGRGSMPVPEESAAQSDTTAQRSAPNMQSADDDKR